MKNNLKVLLLSNVIFFVHGYNKFVLNNLSGSTTGVIQQVPYSPTVSSYNIYDTYVKFEQQPLTTLYKFSGGDGGNSKSSLTTFGNDGFLYGTTYSGGNSGCYNAYGCGTIFKLDPITGTLTTLYKFSGPDGANPSASLTTFGNDGFLYGTTSSGGDSYNGTIFKINPTTGTLTTLYKFSVGDGGTPSSSLISIGNDGFLYGTTTYGGDVTTWYSGCGTIFKINPTTGVLTTLYKFSGNDGMLPSTALTSIGNDGFLYGTTTVGGDNSCPYGCGTIFKINLTTGVFTILYKFSSTVGLWPNSTLTTMGNDGFLYGTTYYGGNSGCFNANGCGTIFKINPITGVLTTLYKFSGKDGSNPETSLITMGHDGLLYGTTYYGGNNSCSDVSGCGTIFKINPTTGVLTTLYSFSETGGAYPYASLITMNNDGFLYGSTYGGGNSSYTCSNKQCGTIFKINVTTQQ